MQRITINAFENVAYFWIERFVSVTSGVFTRGYDEEDRVKFAQTLMLKKPEEWREIFLTISKRVEEEFNANGFYIEFTSVGEKHHNLLNSWLETIFNGKVPDIVLKDNNETDMQISLVSENGAIVAKQGNLYQNGWVIFNRLVEYDANFILTGDKAYLKPEYVNGIQ